VDQHFGPGAGPVDSTVSESRIAAAEKADLAPDIYRRPPHATGRSVME
jgi:hypothetical protein